MNNLSDKILTSILVRVPDCRTLIRLRTVSKRWNSLIANPYFPQAFTNHHSSSPPPWCGFLIRNGMPSMERFHHPVPSPPTGFQPPNYLLFSDGRFDEVVSNDMLIVASFQDMVLLSISTLQYYVQNVTTKRIVRLAKTPYNFDMIPRGFGLVAKEGSFRVALFYHPVLAGLEKKQYMVWVYSSETLEWTRHTFVVQEETSGSTFDYRCYNRDEDSAVCCRGILYWNHAPNSFYQSILRFDPYDDDDDSRWGLANQLPKCQDDTKMFCEYQLCVGESRGRLRMCRMSHGVARTDPICFEVWELAEAEKGLRDDSEWRLVHCTALNGTSLAHYVMVNFHPHDEDVMFLYDHWFMFRYDMKTREIESVGQFPWRITNFDKLSDLPILTLSWPTPI